MLTAALFELDGVLVDVATTRAESLGAAFAAEPAARGLSHERFSVGDPTSVADAVDWLAPFDDLVGMLAPGSADPTTLALAALRAEREYAARVAAGVTLVPGARDAVAAVSGSWRVAVVTGWRRADAERVLALAGLDASVRVLVAADDGPPFPSPAGRVRRALARLHPAATMPNAVAAVVASPAALAAAHAAGARTVLLTSRPAPAGSSGGPTSSQRPPTPTADACLASLRGLTAARLAAALDVVPPRSPSLSSPR